MARSEICKGCCPSGGALFDTVLSNAFLDFDGDQTDFRGPLYVRRCRNCGTEKPSRFRYSAKKKADIARREALLKELQG
jgi:uncharacterized Zn finger protein